MYGSAQTLFIKYCEVGSVEGFYTKISIMEMNKSSETVFSDEKDVKSAASGFSAGRIVSIVILAVGLIFLLAGIVLIVLAVNNDKKATGQRDQNNCEFSREANRVGLGEFLSRVKATYYKLHPYDVHRDPEVKTETIKAEYSAYDPTPYMIKKRTDTALALLKEINDKKINEDTLKPRERKALAQVKHFLQHIFGQPYDVNYYNGDWMMGPNSFCWQEICFHGYAINMSLGKHHKPHNSFDVELIERKLKTHKAGILQFIENMKMGVRKGMVRSVEECEAGINTIKRYYLNVSLYNATGKEKR